MAKKAVRKPTVKTNEAPKITHECLPGETFGIALLEALHVARGQMKPVKQSGRNNFDNYDYSTFGDYLDAYEQAINDAGLLLLVERIIPTFMRSPSDRMPTRCRVTITGRLWHAESGQSKFVEGEGDAFDKGDKALYKAITGARKYLVACLFDLYTDDDPENPALGVEPLEDRSSGKQRIPPKKTSPKKQGKKQESKSPPPTKSSEPVPATEIPKTPQQHIDACETPKNLKALLVRWAKAKPPSAANRQSWLDIVEHSDAHCVTRKWGADDPEQKDVIAFLVDIQKQIIENETEAKAEPEGEKEKHDAR